MRRKLVKQGQNALTVTLPAKWLKGQGLKAGDEVEIEPESNGQVSIWSEKGKPVVMNSHTENVDGMNKYQIKKLTRGLYKSKYDEIVLLFSKNSVLDLKNKKKVKLIDICEEMVNSHIGLEITENKKGKVVLQCFATKENEEKLLVVERRIFFMIKEFMKLVVQDDDIYKKRKEHHDKIAKFCEYYMRAIVNSQTPTHSIAANYSLAGLLDKIADKLRYVCEELKARGKTNKVKKYLEKIFNVFDLLEKLLYSKKDVSKELLEYRYEVIHQIKKENFTGNEYRVIAEALLVLHLINEFFEVKRIRKTN